MVVVVVILMCFSILPIHGSPPTESITQKNMAMDETHPALDVSFFAALYYHLQMVDATHNDNANQQ